MYQEDYLLAKVGICADRHSWFGCPLPEEPLSPGQAEAGRAKEGKMPVKSPLPGEAPTKKLKQGGTAAEGEGAKESGGWFRRHREERRRRREHSRLQQEYMRKLQEYEEQREDLKDNMSRLMSDVFSEVERAGGTGEINCVYEDSLCFLADGEGEAGRCWNALWNIPEFHDYTSLRWAQPLLTYAGHADFIILGTAECISAVLDQLSRHMKSLQWYICTEDDEENVQNWVEDLYEDSGLAAGVRMLADARDFRTLDLDPGAPVCVLDFTEETKTFAGKLARKSIWLDFTSAEEKCRRMARRAAEIEYMSLKKYWGGKSKMKASSYFLDSMWKSGYNTFEI